MIRIVSLSLAAVLCMSGQMVRKEVQEMPSTQLVEVSEIQEPAQPQESSQPQEQKSAARRSMEDRVETSMMRKGAAKRAMELEESR